MTVTAPASRIYAVDLFTHPVSLNEGNRCWIQGLPLGSYQHAIWGEITITPERVANFVRNFYEKVRETDLDIDFDHKAKEEKAAGWIIDVDDRGPQGLWLLVEWTPLAAQSIRDKEYRYFSPEFADEWTNQRTGQTYNDVLFGGGLTNRPFLRDIAPINLSELGQNNNQGEDMDELVKFLSEALGIELSDKEEDSETNLQKVGDAIKSLKEKPTPPTPSTTDPEVVKLAETNPVIAKLLADHQSASRRIDELAARNRLSEVNAVLNVDGELFRLSPALKDELRPQLVKLDEATSTAIMSSIAKMLSKGGLVQLGEVGSSNPARNEEDLVRKFHEEVTKVQEERKLSYADACTAIALEQTELFDAYNDAQLKQGK